MPYWNYWKTVLLHSYSEWELFLPRADFPKAGFGLLKTENLTKITEDLHTYNFDSNQHKHWKYWVYLPLDPGSERSCMSWCLWAWVCWLLLALACSNSSSWSARSSWGTGALSPRAIETSLSVAVPRFPLVEIFFRLSGSDFFLSATARATSLALRSRKSLSSETHSNRK